MRLAMKRCLKCQQEKAAADYYLTAQGLPANTCKKCHNAACLARKKSNPDYRRKQYVAKKRWELRNPQRVRTHQRRCHGRLIWDPQQAGVPSLCRELEAAMWLLYEAISAR